MTETVGPLPPAQAPDIAWWQPKPESPVRRVSQYVTVRDGVKLAVDVYLPAALPEGPRVPAIIYQTRYYRRYAYHPWAERIGNLLGRAGDVAPFVAAGYAVVVVDARGSGASFGHRTTEISPDEVSDGADVCEWIVAQPWSDGTIASTGVSYEGSTAESLLRNRHPAVKACIVRYALFDSYREILAPGGVRSNWFIRDWGELVAAKDRNEEEALLPKIGAGGWLALALPLTAGVAPVDDDADRSQLAAALSEHRDNYDLIAATSGIEFRDDGPSRFGLGPGYDHSPIYHLDDIRASGAVVYSWCAWYDGAYVNGAVKRFIALRDQGCRLILGPWDHGNRQLPDPTTPVVVPSFDHYGEMLRFFDHYLKGSATGIEDEPRVHYYTVGEGRWKACDDWPPPGFAPTHFYLGANGSLTDRSPDDDGEDTYTVDFRASSGLGSRWRTQANLQGAVIGWDDRAAQERLLLVYDSAPLEDDFEVTGHPFVELHMRVDAVDTAVHAYLEEVTADGRVRHVTEGMLRAASRAEAEPPNEWDRLEPYHTFLRTDARPLDPDEVATLRFGLIACSYLFRAGSRVRLALAGADADNFERVPTSGSAPVWRVRRSQGHPSRLVLPGLTR